MASQICRRFYGILTQTYMYKIKIYTGAEEFSIDADEGEILSDVLARAGVYTENVCGGHGKCGKCIVRVDGNEELSCRYVIHSNISVTLPAEKKIFAVGDEKNRTELSENVCFVLDIGSTTLVLAAVSTENGNIIRTISANNPQRKFGADVITRIEYCMKNGVDELRNVLLASVNRMISELGISAENMYVAGNTTMLHTFLGVDCSSIGVSPYRPIFLDSLEKNGADLGIVGVKKVRLLPGISAFVGADIVAGINYCGKPEAGKFNILLDLGTNSEIALWNDEKIYCTSAAAGPCFEGGNISCGMSATDGGIYRFNRDRTYCVIGDVPPEGLCATGLIDLIAWLLEKNILDNTGFIENDFQIEDEIVLKKEDIRNFQLAKSAVYTGISLMMRKAGINFDKVESFFVAGGFSASLDVNSAVKVGLFPKELAGKFRPINNSALLGTVKFAKENILGFDLNTAEYVNLAEEEDFQEEFVENLMFGR